MAIINHGRLVAVGTVEELRDIIGRVAVEYQEDNRQTVRYFPTRDAAKAYSATLGDIYFNIRRTTLEDVFLELTGEDRGNTSSSVVLRMLK